MRGTARNRIRIAGPALAAVLAGCAAAPSGPQPIGRETAARSDLDAQLNAARTDPAGYAGKARALRARFRGGRIERPGEIAVVTREGPAAVDEAIAFLERQAPLPAVRASSGVARAAAGHAADQSRVGGVGHIGSDGSGPADRMRREGRWSATGEAIAYGSDRAEDVILQLIVDDGVPDRGHRRILFNPVYTLVGAACAPHPVWRTVCVLDFVRP